MIPDEMNIYMFDIDETLEVSAGPVKITQLINLYNQGHIIGLCGNWAMLVRNVPQWHRFISLVGIHQGRKHVYLKEVKLYINADNYFFIGNAFPATSIYSDKEEAELSGWQFIHERDFKEGLIIGGKQS